MKKVLLALTAALGLLSYQSQAQAINVGAHLATGLPLGDFGEFSSFGFGGGLTADYYFNDHVNVGVELEYLNFPIDETDESFGITPILLTSAYHTDFGDALDFYGGLGLGAFIKSTSIEGAESATDFGISPRIGAAIELDRRLFLDVSIRYALIFDGQAEETSTFNGQTIVTQPEIGNTSFLGLNVGILYTITQ